MKEEMKNYAGIFLVVMLLDIAQGSVFAQSGLQALTITTREGGVQDYSISIQILLVMTFLTLLPAALLMMTSFTRIVIVLSILRQAIGTAQTPSNQIIIGLSLFLSFFVMMPVLNHIYENSVTPYMEEKINAKQAIAEASIPVREFMMAQTRETDLLMYYQISNTPQPKSSDEIPFSILLPSFVTSELKTAFQIGFLLFIPFLIIDLIVASVLMSMGMMMLSPLIISLPFKLMLFVLVDGWALILGTLASSFYVNN